MMRIKSSPTVPSYSRLRTYGHCERQYYYRYVKKLTSSAEDHPYLLAGKVGHNLMEQWYTSGRATLRKDLHFQDPEREWFNHEHIWDVFANYVEEHPKEDWTIIDVPTEHPAVLSSEAGPMVERALMVNVEDLEGDLADTHMIVVVDLLVERDGIVWVVDHKWTTGYLGQSLRRRVQVDHQLRLYALAMGALLGRPVLGTITNAVYMGQYANNPRSNATKFERYECIYTPEQLDDTMDWYWRRWHGINEYRGDEADVEQGWPQNTGYHCPSCTYYDLCVTSPEQRPRKIERDYVVDDS